MQKKIESALTALALCLALVMTESSQTHAQDQEEGALELDAPGGSDDSAKKAPETEAAPAPVEREVPRDEPEAPTRSEAAPGPWRVYAGVRLGMGGGILFKDADAAWITRFTPGFALGGDYVLHRLFALGVETRFDFASIEPADFMFWSLAVKPRVRHQLKQLPLEIYGAVPGGLSISNAKNDNQTGKASGMVGIAAGASYFFSSHWALNAELGWTWQFLRFEGARANAQPGQSLVALFEGRYGQMALAVNALYAF